MGALMGRVFTPLLEDETLASNVDRFRDFLRSTCGAFFDYMVEHPQVMRLFDWEQAEGWQTFTWSATALLQQGGSTMNTEIGYIHHVGHVVRDIEKARELYQKLGFLCPAPAYPTLSRTVGEPTKPFGAANMHATFARNFIEIMAVVTEESHLPDDAQPIPLQVPPAALARVVENIERTIAKISASLTRFEGLHILVFPRDAQRATTP